MDTKNNFDINNEENFKNFNAKNIQQKPLTDKASPNQKKNSNNIQMSYYFPNNNSLDNSEKDPEFSSNLNSLQDSFSKINIKLNNEISQHNNFNLYEKTKNEPDNFKFYNQNQNFNKSNNTLPPNFNSNAPNFQGNFANPTSPNINYFNNFQQAQNPSNIFQKPTNQLDFQQPEFPSTNNNKMTFQNQSINQYVMQNNTNPPFFDDEQYNDSNNQKDKNRNNKKAFDSSILNYHLQNKSYSQIARFFVIKSVDEDNIHKSIKFRIWCSTFKGNQKLQKAFKEAENAYPIYLFFSVNGSGRFLGLAQMTSEVDYHANFNYWSQGDKWKGFFFVVWLIIKDVPNKAFRHIINEYNEGKPITSSRDTQEIHPAAGMEALKIFKEYPYESSILDDFQFYEKKQNNFSGFSQQQPQQQYYNNMGSTNMNIQNMQNMGNMSNMKTPQNYNQYSIPQQSMPQNEDFYHQKMNMKEYGNNSNNSNINTVTNFPNKNQNYMKKEKSDKNFQPSNYINN